MTGLDDATAATVYFNVVVGRAAAWFHACGLEGEAPVWPEGAHPCMPLSEWKRFFSATIRKPYEHDLFARRELFDLRELSGDPALLAEITSHIAQELEQTDMLVPLLANDTLAHLPPLTVFQGLVLGSDGSERDTLDLAEFIVHPISDAARVFVLGKGGVPIKRSSGWKRLRSILRKMRPSSRMRRTRFASGSTTRRSPAHR